MGENIPPSKRELILKAALDVFSEKGFHEAKIEEIAQEAGIGKGTVYEYFRSKEQLFQEMLKEGMEIFDSLLEEELQAKKTLHEKLAGMIRHNLEIGRRFRPLARIIMMEATIIDDTFRNWLMEMHKTRLQTIADIISEGVKSKEISPVNESLFALLFYGGIGMLIPSFQIGYDKEDIDEMVEEIVDFYLRGLTK